MRLRGDNGYFDRQTDLETAHIRLAANGGQPRLTEFDHTFYNPDGSILRRAHLDLKSGAVESIDPFKNVAGEHTHAPYGMMADAANNLYFLDFGDENIGRVDAHAGFVAAILAGG